MSTFKTYQEIEAWQKARELTNRIYSLTRLNEFHKDFTLTDQLRRACISVMSNIAEGFERDRPKEFVQFLLYAKGSTGEITTQLIIALDQKYIDDDHFKELSDLATEIGKMLGGLIVYLQKGKHQDFR
ncbi:MAG: four helix bundle protein [Candidatus Marinimicrobia bacterium]|nr:four helix bundle protein [Candidatus Neomarinimicrobiota bacterium]MCK9484636.1 four helix bundle protein [Candidatus Neomarinimicrobiota bacterium]MCK9560738.1 four helix bundle protein [Candidatus Neomarinimicrobiota bacterium]